MKQFLFLLTFFLPLSGVSSGYRGYQKALDAYARDRSPENFFAFESAYRSLADSRTTLRGEILAAEALFKNRLNEKRSIDLFLEAEAIRALAAREAQRQELESALAEGKARVTQLEAERGLLQTELATLNVQLEALEKARATPEREAQYEQLRTTIRSLKDTADITAATPPAAIQNRMDRLLELYARADHFAQITKKPADEGLRKSIVIPLRNLFALYQGPDGKRGDASIRNAYRARIGDLLNREGITTIKMPPTAEDIETLD